MKFSHNWLASQPVVIVAASFVALLCFFKHISLSYIKFPLCSKDSIQIQINLPFLALFAAQLTNSTRSSRLSALTIFLQLLPHQCTAHKVQAQPQRQGHTDFKRPQPQETEMTVSYMRCVVVCCLLCWCSSPLSMMPQCFARLCPTLSSEWA